MVAADGSGDFPTISEAVAAAVGGDTVLVRPGEYEEVVVIDKRITLAGDGPREDIVLSFPPNGATVFLDPYEVEVAFPLQLREDSDATVRGMTIRAPVEGGSVLVDGAPLLEDLALLREPGAYGSIAIGGQARPVVRASLIEGDVNTQKGVGGMSPIFEGNTIRQATLDFDGPGEAIVRDNTFLVGAGLSAASGMTGVIDGNTFSGGGIRIESDSDFTVRDNKVTGSGHGVYVGHAATAVIEANELVDNSTAITWGSTMPGVIEGNTIRGGAAGIVVADGSPTVIGNTVTDASARGIAVTGQGKPLVSENTVCGCGTNLWVGQTAAPEMGENEICADGSAG